MTFKPPKFAIADGFVAGAYQEIDNANYIERQAIGLVQIRGMVKVVYGGPGNILTSHLLSWDNRHATIASRVPNVVARDNFQLVIAGPMTSAQELLLAKRHECSGQRVRQAHDLLRRINPLYADVGVDEALLARSADSAAVTTHLEDDDDTQELIARARARQATITRVEDGPVDDTAREGTLVESETMLVETTTDQNEHDRLARAVGVVTAARDTYVVRRSTAIQQSDDPHYMERLFPHLLTFGVGGFSTVRQNRYSRRAVVLHYLNLSTNRFAEDPLFKLAMFDYLATQRVKSGVFLRVGQDPSLATIAMRVAPGELKTAMRSRIQQREAWKSGRPLEPSVGESSARTLLRSINAASAKMWGSNEERESMTRKADCMTIRFGAPSVFWTLTPNPDCSLVCAFWTGHALPNGRPESLSKCGEVNMPCASKMARLIMTNTVVQAQYYQICCRVLIDILFGWDLKANRPKSQRGLFGFVEALLFALEQQGRLFVHHHGVAWIAGLPKTQSDWDRLLDSRELRRRFEEYCASIFAAELPVYDSLEVIRCLRSGCSGQLVASTIPKKFKHLLRSSVAAPVVASCDVCDEGFNEPEIVASIIEEQWAALDEENRSASSTNAVESIRHKFCGLSQHPATARVQLSRLLLKDQIHAWTHTQSCVKGRSGSRCRYKFYRKLVPATRLSAKNEIVYRRRLGNQWLNTFVPLWRRVFHFNMDARLLWSGDSLQAARYALQYTMKRQTVLDNVAVVNIAFDRRVSREMALQTAMLSKGIGRLLSLAYASSGVMEIGGPLATAILLEGEAVSFGCVFERMVLLDGLNLMKNIAVEATVISRGHQLFAETSISKYLLRPSCMERYCWYDYCSWISRIGTFKAGAVQRCAFVSDDPHRVREHMRDHGYHHVEYSRVPEIIGPRLPDASRLGDEDYTEQTELYYRMAALLYRPFRNVLDFLDASGSAESHFEQWMPFEDPVVARRLEYHQQHYIGLQRAQEYRAKEQSSSDSESDEDGIYDDDDVLVGASYEQRGGARGASRYEAVPAEFYGVDVDMEAEPNVTAEATLGDTTPITQLLHESIAASALPPDDSLRLTVRKEIITRSQIRNFGAGACGTVDTPAYSTGGPTALDGTTKVVVDSFHQAIRDLSYDRTWLPPSAPEPRASIQDVSAHFRLNKLQHVAFTLIAVPLLSMLTGVPIPTTEHDLFDDAPIIVTGAGGTGKSQIIAAVRALAAAWDCPHAIAVVASTGIVAASLQGTTMYSSVGLGVNATVVPKRITSPADSLLRQWAPVRCVIADELSMVDLGFFGLWEESLGYVKEDRGRDYGGLLTVLMFDHCQLRCVKGLPMFKTDNGGTPLTPAQDRGRLLYRKIRKVVYLTENMRFVQDPEWGCWLAKGRLGNWTSKCRAFIASILDREPSQAVVPQSPLTTISTDNSSRTVTNETAIAVAARCFGTDRKVYVIPAHLSRRVSEHEVDVVRRLPDNKTGHIPLFLHVYVGMPVRVKSNQCVPKGVANGASATVHHIDWEPSTEFSLQPDGTWLASAQPRNVFLSLTDSSSATRFPGIPAHWPPSVMPIHQTTAPIRKMVPSLSIRGFPIVPAFGTTVHGVQGQTLDAAAVSNLRPPHVGRVDTHALYVTLSRLRTRHGLHWIGALPTDSDFNFFRPDPSVLLEDNRLSRLAETTLSVFNHVAHCIAETS